MTPTSAPSGLKLTEEFWQDLLDKDDRNSPAEYPDMALITHDEFAGYIRAACNEKDAEISRLQTLAVGPLSYAAQRARADDAEARLAAMAAVTEALERIAAATPSNTNSRTATDMWSWCKAVADCALEASRRS